MRKEISSAYLLKNGQANKACWLAYTNGNKNQQKINRIAQLIAFMFLFVTVAKANTYIVNTASDNVSGTNPAAGAATGTLRQTIIDANANAGADIINFVITGAGVKTLTLLAELPVITGATAINGYSQTGAAQGAIGSRTILIEINGNKQIMGGGAGRASLDGLFRFTATASNSSLSGLAIYNTGQNVEAIMIEPGNSNIHIWGNYIGTLANGTSPAASALYNGDDDIYLGHITTATGTFTNITIGTNGDGTNDANEGNVISNAAGTLGGDGIGLGLVPSTYTYNNLKISGNYIGVEANGVTPAPNGLPTLGAGEAGGQSGIVMAAPVVSSTVLIGTNGDGTSDALERNIISGNNGYAIGVVGGCNLKIAGNYIGTDYTGLVALPNGKKASTGIYPAITFTSWVASTTAVIGFDDATHAAAVASTVRNIISGNQTGGILVVDAVATAAIKISGNYIGVDVTGNTALPNGQGAGLTGTGIDLNNAQNVLIGTDADGTNDLLERNVISGASSGRGINIRGGTANTIITGNYIGVGADGTTAVGNSKEGVRIGSTTASSSNIRVGSNDNGANDDVEPNIIANNGTDATLAGSRSGVSVIGIAGTGSVGNRISRNIFYNNRGLAIDLSDDAITLNDGVTTANSSNLLLDYPVVTGYSIAGSTISVAGYVSTCSGNETTAGTSITGNKTIQFYKSSDDGDQNGALTNSVCTRSVTHGEGFEYLGSITAIVNAFSGSFVLPSGASFASNDKLTAIAIDASGNTSEFGVTTVQLQVSGNVFNDTNGLSNGTVDGTGSNAGGLNVILYNNTTNTVAGVAAVATDGTYSFGISATPGNSFTAYVTTNTATVGSAAVPVVVLPVGWGNVGENLGASVGNDGTSNGILSIGAVSISKQDANFGIQTGFYDFGDAPDSYNTNSANAAVAPRNAATTSLRLGTLPDMETTAQNVASGTDNNTTNGDGADEDGITTPTAITINVAYTRAVTVTNTTGTSYNLHGWIDFNNNGIFETAEYTSVNVPTATNGATLNLTWSATQTKDALASNLYMRLRLAAATLADNAATAVDERAIADGLNTGIYGTASIGEVEDYRVTVTPAYDFGDAPTSFEANNANLSLPARHLPVATLRLGSTEDIESSPQNVANSADNNGTNGDGADEDGITNPLSILLNQGGATSISVNITKTLAGTANLYGWLDMDGNGRFAAGEMATVATTASVAGASTLVLNWPILPATTQSKVYLRLRFTTAPLTDNATTTAVDERSIADGVTGGVYGITINGEVEDYQLTVAPMLSGTVWNDADGSLNINGTEAGTNTGTAIFVNLLDASNNVINSVPVAANGSYSLAVPASSTGYKLVLATTATAIVPSLTGAGTTWVNTGENVNSSNTASQASSPVGEIALTTGTTAIIAQNFGIERKPTSTNATAASQPNPAGTTAAAVPATVFNGTDTEDGIYATNLSGRKVMLNAASNGTLYYDGLAVTTSTSLTSFDPSKVTLDPTATGATSPTFTYNVFDNAGVPSANITVTVPFTVFARTFSGTVWQDDNSNAIKDGTEVFTNAGNIYANLTTSAGVVISSVLVNPITGVYSLGGAASTAYTVILSDGPKVVGSTLLGASLPTYWSHSGVNVGGISNIINKTGVISISSGTGNLSDRNFGVNQITSSTAACNPGGTSSDLYDKIIGAWHGTIIQNSNGGFSCWGQYLQPGGYDGDNTNGQLNLADITPANGYNYTGTPLKAALASGGRESQAFLLTTAGLYVWGYHGEIIAASLTTANGTSGDPFQKLTVNTKTDGLPTGVLPADVKMMTASDWGGLIILTYAGTVYCLSNFAYNYGDGVTVSDAIWHQAKLNATTPLTGVDILRQNSGGVFAITTSNNWYTWGIYTRLGDGSVEATKTFATLMTKPAAFTSVSDVKMIAMSNGSIHSSYYVLHAVNKTIYSMGYNDEGQLGNGTTTATSSWGNVLTPGSGTSPLANVKFISANDNEVFHAAAAAILDNGTLYTWGSNSEGMIGAPAATANSTRPRVPDGFVVGTDKALYVEVGGHFTEFIKNGNPKPCYMGHYIGGSSGNGTKTESHAYAIDCSQMTAPVTICGATSFDAGDVPAIYEDGNNATHLLLDTPLELGWELPSQPTIR